MTVCKVCGNDYNPSFKLHSEREIESFDCFECAFYAVAPMCACCKGKINMQGIEIGGVFFCCTHCASEYQARELEPVGYAYANDPISLALGPAFC